MRRRYPHPQPGRPSIAGSGESGLYASRPQKTRSDTANRKATRLSDFLQPLIDVSEQVRLCLSVQTEARLIQKDDDILAAALSHLRKKHQKGEKPDETAAPVVEFHGNLMQRIVNPSMKDSALVERRRISGLRRIQTEKHAKTTVLRPILEHLASNFVGGGLQPGLKRLKLLDGTNLFQADTHEVQESKKYGFARREMA